MEPDRRFDTKRVRAVLSCHMVASGTINRIVVANISSTGIGGRTMKPLAPGDEIRIELPGIGGVEAVIRWSAGTRFGAKLRCAIPLEKIRLPHMVAGAPRSSFAAAEVIVEGARRSVGWR